METSKPIIDQIKADMYNIQVLIDMLPYVKKTKYSQIQATIKTLVREIKKEKELINDKLFRKQFKKDIPLFEIEPSEIETVDIDNLSSFFGLLE